MAMCGIAAMVAMNVIYVFHRKTETVSASDTLFFSATQTPSGGSHLGPFTESL